MARKSKYHRHTRYNGGIIRPRPDGQFIAEVNHHGARKRKVYPDEATCRAWIDKARIEEGRIIAIPSERDLIDAYEARKIAPPGVSLRDAMKYYVEQHPAGVASKMTLNDAFVAYLQDKTSAGMRPRSLSELKYTVGRLVASMPDRTLDSISTDDLQKWSDDMELAPTNRSNHKRGWHGFFGWAIKRGWMLRNPAAGISESLQDEREIEIWTPAEAKAILDAAWAGSHNTIVPFLAIAMFAGLRTAEILQLRWEEVAASMIRVVAKSSKGRRPRYVPITDNLQAWIKPFRAFGLVAPFSQSSRDRWIADILATAKIPAWKDNACRHSFGSYRSQIVQSTAQVALEMGQRGDDVLFEHYKALVPRDAAEAYFAIVPPMSPDQNPGAHPG